MKQHAIYIDNFSVGLDELSRKDQANPEKILSVIRETGTFSVFEATDNDVIAGTLTALNDRMTTDPDSQYPWIKVTHIDGQPI